MPLVTDMPSHGGTRDAPEQQQGRDHRATLHLLRLQWIGVDFIGICILEMMDLDTQGAVKAQDTHKIKGSPHSLVQNCAFSD